MTTSPRAMAAREIRDLPALMSPTTAARALGFGRTTAARWLAKGEFPLPVRPIGRRQYVAIGDLLEYLNLHQGE